MRYFFYFLTRRDLLKRGPLFFMAKFTAVRFFTETKMACLGASRP